MRGTITIIDKGDVRVHSYMAPDDNINVTTQLIETPGRLVAVDGQISIAAADEVVEYAKGLGKPLDRLIITHEHPDHFQGAARFNAPIHALAVTRDQMAARGDLTDPTGIPVPAAEVAPPSWSPRAPRSSTAFLSSSKLSPAVRPPTSC